MCMSVFILYTHPTNKDFSDHPIVTLASQGLCVQRGFTIGACVFQTPALDCANAAQSLTRESCRPLCLHPCDINHHIGPAPCGS